MRLVSGKVQRFISIAFVILSGAAMSNHAVCQVVQPGSASNCSDTDTANWTTNQKQLLTNTVVPIIQKRIARHWIIPKQDFSGLPHATACVSFILNANGDITGAKIVRSSHSDYFDQLALNAVKSASPLDPLPAALRVTHLSVVYTFTYAGNGPFDVLRFAPLNLLPHSFKEPRTSDSTFSLVVSTQPSFTEPLGSLKDCCLEKWAEMIQNEWATLVASSKDKNLVEIQASIEPDGSVDNLTITNPSGDGRVDREAMKSISDSKLMMKVAIHKPVRIRLDFLANETPEQVVVATSF